MLSYILQYTIFARTIAVGLLEECMKRTAYLIMTAGLLLSASGSSFAQEVHEVYIGEIGGMVTIDGVDYLMANEEIVIPIHIRNSGTPDCTFAPAMSFVVESPDGAEWKYTALDYYTELRSGMWWPYWWTISDYFSSTFMDVFSADGKVGDTVGFAGIVMPDDIGIGNYDLLGLSLDVFDEKCLLLKIHPTQESVGKTICITYGGERNDGFDWGWSGVGIDCDIYGLTPDFVGAQCFEVLDYQSICCTYNTEGMTGNTDCDLEERRNLADITRLIDNIYISKQSLCCLASGNVDGDAGNAIDIADITRLIDHVYLSKSETDICK